MRARPLIFKQVDEICSGLMVLGSIVQPYLYTYTITTNYTFVLILDYVTELYNKGTLGIICVYIKFSTAIVTMININHVL